MPLAFTGTAAASFSASHVVPGHPRCGRMHGHRWTIEVAITAGQDTTTGELHRLAELAEAIETICDEIDREHVNDMFPASDPTPAGVALSVRERLILDFPQIAEVRVWADSMSASLHA